MPSTLQIQTRLLDIEAKNDKNGQLYYRLSLAGTPGRYFYAFSYNLPELTWKTLIDTPHHLINRQVLIAYEELPNKDNSGTFYKVRQITLT